MFISVDLEVVLILIVVGRGLVLSYDCAYEGRKYSLNPYCSWTWTSTSDDEEDENVLSLAS